MAPPYLEIPTDSKKIRIVDRLTYADEIWPRPPSKLMMMRSLIVRPPAVLSPYSLLLSILPPLSSSRYIREAQTAVSIDLVVFMRMETRSETTISAQWAHPWTTRRWRADRWAPPWTTAATTCTPCTAGRTRSRPRERGFALDLSAVGRGIAL